MFINGTKDTQSYLNMRGVNRTSNFFGGNNWNENFNGELDDLKIFHKALENNEIIDEFN